jgi:hypothetical protein
VSRFHVQTDRLDYEVIADDDADALGQSVDADLLHDGDEGGLEELPEIVPAGWVPEGPG